MTAPQSEGAPSPIKVWDSRNGKLLRVINGHTKGLFQISFSPDGSKFYSCGFNNYLREWNVKTEAFRDIPSPTQQWIRAVVTSSQRKIAFAQDKLFILDQNSAEIKTIDRSVGPICFSPDGTLLAGTTWQSGEVTLWDADTDEEIDSWWGHNGRANGCCFSKDGKVLFTAGSDYMVRAWDVKTQEAILELEHLGEAYGIGLSPDGKTLATSGYDGLIHLWDIASFFEKPPLANQ